MKHLNVLGVSLTLALGTAMSAPVNAQTTLIFNSYLPKVNASYKAAIEEFSKQIEAESGGSIKVTIPDASLAPSGDQYPMLIDGVADLAIINTEDMSQQVILNQIATLPYNAPTSEAASVALWETYEKYFATFDEFKGLKVLSVHVLPGRQFVGIGRPLASPEDFKGTKIWAAAGLQTEVTEKLGAVPVNLPFPALAESVNKGVLDGLIITLGSTLSSKLMDKVGYYTEVPGGIGSLGFIVAMRMQAWEGLTADQQAAVLKAANGLPRRTGIAIDGIEKKAHTMTDKIKVSVAPEALIADLKPILGAYVGKWKEEASAKGLSNPDEVLEFYSSVVKREQAK